VIACLVENKGTFMTKLMQFSRASMVACLAIIAVTAPAAAQDKYPERSVRVIIPFAAGSASDVVGRIVLDRMADDLGHRFVVENQAGASGNLGTAAAARATPDGYTILVSASGPLAVNPSLFSNMGYDPLTAFEPISLLATLPNVIVVNANQPYRSVDDLVAAARKSPGSLNYGSIGNGSSQHLAAALFRTRHGYADDPRALSGDGPARDRSRRQSVAGEFSAHSQCHRSGQGRTAQGPRGHIGQTFRSPAGCADDPGGRHCRI
jgi:tripartite-type tricarboxylate transporter receptor subunit TctC